MRFHAYQNKSLDKLNVPQYYAFCGTKGINGHKFFYAVDGFKDHYAKDLACKKCTKALIKFGAIKGGN